MILDIYYIHTIQYLLYLLQKPYTTGKHRNFHFKMGELKHKDTDYGN